MHFSRKLPFTAEKMRARPKQSNSFRSKRIDVPYNKVQALFLERFGQEIDIRSRRQYQSLASKLEDGSLIIKVKLYNILVKPNILYVLFLLKQHPFLGEVQGFRLKIVSLRR